MFKKNVTKSNWQFPILQTFYFVEQLLSGAVLYDFCMQMYFGFLPVYHVMRFNAMHFNELNLNMTVVYALLFVIHVFAPLDTF